VRTLDGLRKLAPNWDIYSAEPPAQNALHRASEVLEALDAMRVRPDRVAGSAEGGVAIAVVREQRYARDTLRDASDSVTGRDRRSG
jgi:hypothetical protein